MQAIARVNRVFRDGPGGLVLDYLVGLSLELRRCHHRLDQENVRANLWGLLRRVLRAHEYPPDKQESATRTAIEQAEVLLAGSAF